MGVIVEDVERWTVGGECPSLFCELNIWCCGDGHEGLFFLVGCLRGSTGKLADQ
jgi:hypothetical protein